MDNTCRVLLGLQQTLTESTISFLKQTVIFALQEQRCCFTSVYTVEDFCTEISDDLGAYQYCIAVDDLSTGNGYSLYMGNSVRYGNTVNIVIVPRDSYRSVHLDYLLGRGIYNAIYGEEFNRENLSKLIRQPRTALEAEIYYGLNGIMRSRMEPVVEEVPAVIPKKEVVRRKLAEGIYVTRVYGQDFAKEKNADMGETASVLDFLKNKDELAKKLLSNEEMTGGEMDIFEFPLEPGWVEDYKNELKQYFQKQGLGFYQSYQKGKMTKREFADRVYRLLSKYDLEDADAELVFNSFIGDVDAYGKLNVIIDTPDVSDIRLINKDNINIQYKGKWYKSNITFNSEEDYSYLINRICTRNQISLNVQSAQIIFSDPDTNPNARLRFTASHGILNTDKNMTMHIRKVDKVKKDIHKLVADGFFTIEQASFLVTAIIHKRSMFICGGSGSGKTVLVNFLLEHFPAEVCGICMQESDELFSERLKNMEWQHSISAKGEGKVEHSLRQLTTTGLLKNSQLFIIGEIKGDEARDYLTAGNTGAQCISTGHANAFYEAITRLADLIKYQGDYSQEELMKMLVRAVNTVVYMEKYSVVDIVDVVCYDEEKKDVVYDLYEFESSKKEKVTA